MNSFNSSKLFVADLNEYITEKNLYDYFCTYGEIIAVNKSKKYGFITFSRSDDAISVLRTGNYHYIKGKRVEVYRASGVNERELHVVGLTQDIFYDDLFNYFSKRGKVISIKRPYNRHYCFVLYNNAESAESVLREACHIIKGVLVQVSRSEFPIGTRFGAPPLIQETRWPREDPLHAEWSTQVNRYPRPFNLPTSSRAISCPSGIQGQSFQQIEGPYGANGLGHKPTVMEWRHNDQHQGPGLPRLYETGHQIQGTYTFFMQPLRLGQTITQGQYPHQYYGQPGFFPDIHRQSFGGNWNQLPINTEWTFQGPGLPRPYENVQPIQGSYTDFTLPGSSGTIPQVQYPYQYYGQTGIFPHIQGQTAFIGNWNQQPINTEW